MKIYTRFDLWKVKYDFDKISILKFILLQILSYDTKFIYVQIESTSRPSNHISDQIFTKLTRPIDPIIFHRQKHNFLLTKITFDISTRDYLNRLIKKPTSIRKIALLILKTTLIDISTWLYISGLFLEIDWSSINLNWQLVNCININCNISDTPKQRPIIHIQITRKETQL